MPTSLMWFRRDLRLADNDAVAAAAAGGAVVPVFLLDPETEALGAASRWRLGAALGVLRDRLRAAGSDLVLRRGPAVEAIPALAIETGAEAVYWTRLYAPETVARDAAVKAALGGRGHSHPGFLLHEPWQVATQGGTPFRVFGAFRAAADRRDVAAPTGVPRLSPPEAWPASDDLGDWRLGAAMDRGAGVVARFARVGEAAARERLDGFLEEAVARYPEERDRPDRDGTSRLSEHLTWGEISPRLVWHAAERAGRGGEAFRRQLVWREFAWHLHWHSPDLGRENWRRDWDRFPWCGDGPEVDRWRRGETGIAMVDAGMRELYATGTMHNRVRMLVASFLSKHLLTDWRVGLKWFEDCLIDWDPAANALNWQWVAGSGPDAAPYFRVFSPERQAERFDPDGAYRRRFLEGEGAAAFLAAAPRSWGLAAGAARPAPVVGIAEGRQRALAVYAAFSGR